MGICNTGIDIKGELLFYKYFLLFHARSIDLKELKQKVGVFWPYFILEWNTLWESYQNITNIDGISQYNEMHNLLLEKDSEYFLKSLENYKIVKEIVAEVSPKLPVIDSEGNQISSIEEQLSNVEEITHSKIKKILMENGISIPVKVSFDAITESQEYDGEFLFVEDDKGQITAYKNPIDIIFIKMIDSYRIIYSYNHIITCLFPYFPSNRIFKIGVIFLNTPTNIFI